MIKSGLGWVGLGWKSPKARANNCKSKVFVLLKDTAIIKKIQLRKDLFMPWRAIIYMIDPAEKQKGATQKDGTKKDVIKKDPKKKVQKKGAIRKRCDMKFKHAKIPTVQRAIDKTDCVGRHFSLNCQKTFSQKSPQFSSSQRPKIPLLMTGTHTNKGSEVRELIRETQDINMDRLLFGEGRGGYQPLIPLLGTDGVTKTD